MYDVSTELDIPPQSIENHWLTFSQIEKHFYQKQHDDCATLFQNIVTRFVFLWQLN